MIIDCVQSIPFLLWLVTLYILMSAYASLSPRLVWVPVSILVPLLFLGAQTPLVLGLSLAFRLIVAAAFGVGVAIGGSVLRPRIIRVFTQKRFEIAGDVMTAILLGAAIVVKLAAACGGVWFEGDIEYLNCVSAVIGTFVPAVLLGRAYVLFMYKSIA